MAKIVIALGGNALQVENSISYTSQLKACQHTAANIVALVKLGHQIAIVHGNGPQVGEIITDVELAHKASAIHPLFPLDVCDALTQGYIGYYLQNTIGTELIRQNILIDVVTIITQLEVAKDDPAFLNPTKPIGPFYTKNEADKLTIDNKFVMKDDARHGYRRMVASPKPLNIIEKNTICHLFNSGVITISCGGGGIPVVRENNQLMGVAAVIDKDFAAAKLACVLNADLLMILTTVSQVALNFHTPLQQNLTQMDVADAEKYIAKKHFAPGSMLPKIQAAISFVKDNPDRKVIIASLNEALSALDGLNGTLIINKKNC